MATDRGPALAVAPAAGWTGDPRAGILLVLASTVFFAGLDTGVKYLTQFYPILQIAWARYLFQMALVPFVVGRVKPRDVFRNRRPGLQVVRSLLLMGATLSFFTAVRYMPLADASAIGMVAPLMVTALAIPLLGERVGARRWTAVVIGLIGALIIIRPGLGVAHWAAVLPLITALCYAFYQITTRILAAVDPPVTTFLYTGVVGTLVLTVAMPFVWQPPTAWGWAMLIAAGLLWFAIRKERVPSKAALSFIRIATTVPR